MPIYRGDSFICQAAIHAGVIGNGIGGCGVATLTGSHHNFQPSEAYGIQSIGFPASFPRTFTFQSLSASQAQCPADSRWPLFAVTATALVLLWLLTTSPASLFFSTFFILCLHVGLVSDPPNTSNFHELLSTLASRLLPGAFIAWILYRYCAVPALNNLTAQIEKTILYLGFCLVGALNNYTFAPLIPIQRLTPHDIKSQPGAPIALAIIIICIVSIVITQIRSIRKSGQMPRYLKLYVSFLLGLLILLLLPGMRLRIHHYILAILFMPGTAMQTRPALVYQGLLLGLFINGATRWGFASIIQTPAALGERGGGQGGSWWGATSPNVTATVGADGKNISLHWGQLPTEKGIDGVSILIDDVERWRGYVDAELYWNSEGVTLRGKERRSPSTRDGEEEPEFYRFAWMNGNTAGRYGGVSIWDERGEWIPPKESIKT
jgi:LCCL domain